jgi:hypothetical protein
MKITVTGGVVRATAESLVDIKFLLGLKDNSIVRRKKHKRRVSCTVCGKMVKSLKMHTTLSHPAEGIL